MARLLVRLAALDGVIANVGEQVVDLLRRKLGKSEWDKAVLRRSSTVLTMPGLPEREA